MNVHKCMNINLQMIIIISYDKQVTIFFNKHFMDSYGVEHLLKMSHHTMHSPCTLFSRIRLGSKHPSTLRLPLIKFPPSHCLAKITFIMIFNWFHIVEVSSYNPFGFW